MSAPKQLDFRASFAASGDVFDVRPVEERDIESLRTWKNEHRAAFFHQQTISAAQQAEWFEAFLARAKEQLFMLEHTGRPIACVGFRLLEGGAVDLFNLILGANDYRRRGVASAFYQCLEDGLAQRGIERVELKVLPNNRPAISFYQRHGFRIAEENDQFLLMGKPIR